jgi:hypothetical protein
VPPGGAPVPPEREDNVRPHPRAPRNLSLAGPARDRCWRISASLLNPACSIFEASREDAVGEQGIRNMILDCGGRIYGDDIPRRAKGLSPHGKERRQARLEP